MHTKQLSIDDYLGGKTPEQNEQVEALEAVQVEYDKLTKEELIKVLKDKDQALENYKTMYETKEQEFNRQVEVINQTYKDNMDKMHTINVYLTNKLNVIKGIITMEEGEK